MYNKKFLLSMDYDANDEYALKLGVKQLSPVNPALRNQDVQENYHHLIALGLSPAGSILQN